jgi:hypothetical protein
VGYKYSLKLPDAEIFTGQAEITVEMKWKEQIWLNCNVRLDATSISVNNAQVSAIFDGHRLWLNLEKGANVIRFKYEQSYSDNCSGL